MQQFPIAHSHQVTNLMHPKLNQRSPHELHWRHQPPKCEGSVDRAYLHLYPHLEEEVLCMQCGAVPCPYDHDEMKNNRLKDLEFVRELARERKEMRAKVEQIQREMGQMANEHTEWQIDKQKLMDQVKFQEMLHKEAEREKKQLEQELSRLKELNNDNLRKVQESKKDKEKIEILSKRLSDMETQHKIILEESARFQKELAWQRERSLELESQRDEAFRQLDASKSEVSLLRLQVTQVNQEADKCRKELWESEERMQKLNDDIAKLLAEIGDKTKVFQEKEMESRSMIEKLGRHIRMLQGDLEASQNGNAQHESYIRELLSEIEWWKRKLSSDKSFRKFVDIKREVNDLRDKNELLSHKVNVHQISQPRPVMKRNGRVTSAGSHVKSLGLNQSEHRTSMLNRPKSALTLKSADEFLS